MPQSQSFLSIFKQLKLKATPHRMEILHILHSVSQPIAADEIYDILHKKNNTISLSTVYRTLDTMIEKAIITKIGIDNDSRCLYEIKPNTCDHHHFLICIRCGKIFSIDDCPFEQDIQHLIEIKHSFKITTHKLELYGYCSDCLPK